MKFTLMEVRGLADACLALKMSRRSYTQEYEDKLRDAIVLFTNSTTGFILNGVSNWSKDCSSHFVTSMKTEYDWFIDELNKIAKWGAGVGVDTSIDAGHETILRFIDFSIHVEGLHRGAMDDFDAHAMRMNNRIVRSSTRGNGAYNPNEISDWYKDKIIPAGNAIQAQNKTGFNTVSQNIIVIDGVCYKFTGDGYIREDLVENGDAQRGLYRLSIPMDCICKINLHDMRHIYMRRNKYTHASPELAYGIEMLADQIEEALPCHLGKLVRYDYCIDADGYCDMHHIMDIEKVYVPREKKSSIEDIEAAKFDALGD